MALPRLVFGETSRERELRALSDEYRSDRDCWARRADADRKAFTAAIAALRDALENAIDERDEARRERDEALAERDEARRQRDEGRDQRAVRRAEGLRSFRYRLRELIDRHDDVDRRLAEASEAVAGWRHIAEQILRPWPPAPAADDIEPTDDSPEDRPATDSGAEGAGTEPD